MHPVLFFCIINKLKDAVKHNKLMSYHRMSPVLCEPKHVAVCEMTFKCCVGWHLLVCLCTRTKPKCIMLFREIIAMYCESEKAYIALC